MFTPVAALAAVVAVAAAVRSTWSPCGLSMLSTMTPLAERARGHRWAATAAWYWLGAVVGGAGLGAVAAAVAALVSLADLGATTSLALTAGAALLAASVDLGRLGPPIPHRRRQVDEDWLGRYRPWVYGVGFGLQIGSGFATYVMTAAVYLTVALAVLSGPAAALAVCVLFGFVRGSAVLLAARLTSFEASARFHERFEAAREPVRRSVVAVELAACLVAVVVGGSRSAVGVVAGLAVVAVATFVTRHRPVAGTAPAPEPS